MCTTPTSCRWPHREWLERLNGLPTGLEPKPEPPEPKPPEPPKKSCEEKLANCRATVKLKEERIRDQAETIAQLQDELTKQDKGDDMPDEPPVNPRPPTEEGSTEPVEPDDPGTDQAQL